MSTLEFKLLGYATLGKLSLENASLTISNYLINTHKFEQKVTVVFQKVLREHLPVSITSDAA